MWRSLWRGAIDLLYPPACLVCSVPLPDRPELEGSPDRFVCVGCAGSLARDPSPTCPRCAATVGPGALIEEGCGLCRPERLAFEGAVRLGPYVGLLREAILRIKHRRQEGLAELLGELLGFHRGEALRKQSPDVIVPVPLHWWRRFRRGYNQCEAVARGLAATLQIPVAICLSRVRSTRPQSSVPASSRKDNVRGAFRAWGTIVTGRTVLLLDDVVTTGATVHEAAQVLRQAGASRVLVAMLARAGMD